MLRTRVAWDQIRESEEKRLIAENPWFVVFNVEGVAILMGKDDNPNDLVQFPSRNEATETAKQSVFHKRGFPFSVMHVSEIGTPEL